MCERGEKGRREEGGAAGGRGDPVRVGGQKGSDGGTGVSWPGAAPGQAESMWPMERPLGSRSVLCPRPYRKLGGGDAGAGEGLGGSAEDGEGRIAHAQDEAWWLLACEGPLEEQERREGGKFRSWGGIWRERRVGEIKSRRGGETRRMKTRTFLDADKG